MEAGGCHSPWLHDANWNDKPTLYSGALGGMTRKALNPATMWCTIKTGVQDMSLLSISAWHEMHKLSVHIIIQLQYSSDGLQTPEIIL